jgi:hypothetical protein
MSPAVAIVAPTRGRPRSLHRALASIAPQGRAIEAEEMALLATAFPENIKLFRARGDGVLLGGVIVYETDVVAHVQYIAATEQGYAEHALDAGVDFLIEVEYSHNRWFDFGISTTEDGRSPNLGLVRNKESFGARAVAYDTYPIELNR